LVSLSTTLVGEGVTRGAVYFLCVDLMPTVAFPPAIPFTLHVTYVLVAFTTSAEKFCVLPSRTAALVGVTLTEIGEGGGGGGGATGLAPPPPQPSVHALAMRRTRSARPIPRCRRSHESIGMPPQIG